MIKLIEASQVFVTSTIPTTFNVSLQAATVLNSKDKAPYIIYVECVEMLNGGDVSSAPITQKIVNTLRHVKSVEQLHEDNDSPTTTSSSSPGVGAGHRLPESVSMTSLHTGGCGTGDRILEVSLNLFGKLNS